MVRTNLFDAGRRQDQSRRASSRLAGFAQTARSAVALGLDLDRRGLAFLHRYFEAVRIVQRRHPGGSRCKAILPGNDLLDAEMARGVDLRGPAKRVEVPRIQIRGVDHL